MRKRSAWFLAFLLILAAIPRPASARPEKVAGPLDVTYYFLPT